MYLIRVVFLSALFVVFVHSCATETVSKTYVTNKELPNGILLSVEKTNTENTQIGMFTKHNYGTTHSYSYKVIVEELDAVWEGKSGEPKKLVFCKDSLFLLSYKEMLFTNDSLRKIDSTLAYESHYEVVEEFQKYVDNRYFFKLFGDAYWVSIPSSCYQYKKSSCKEYDVPNDNELSLIFSE
ncbi:MAG: hypothetical protein N4A35_12510 [Flavobacteriales bacterium]|jgi:hypothetical protein|nr:hypothetical protein [Flavobacteriales bacterium]